MVIRCFVRASIHYPIVLQNLLMNLQMEGVNSNNRCAKFEEIAP